VCGDLDELIALARARIAASGRVLTRGQQERYGLA
jgi:hypothetical protein